MVDVFPRLWENVVLLGSEHTITIILEHRLACSNLSKAAVMMIFDMLSHGPYTSKEPVATQTTLIRSLILPTEFACVLGGWTSPFEIINIWKP